MFGPKLGSGTYGCVYEHLTDPKRAWKVVDMKDAGWFSSILELDILGRVQHPYILGSNHIEFKQDSICIELPRASSDLYTLITKQQVTISSECIDKYLVQLASAIHFLHKCGYVHYDICEQNILVFDDHVKLADFSLAGVKQLNDEVPLSLEDHNFVCRNEITPPEFLLINLNSSETPKTHPCLSKSSVSKSHITCFDWWAYGLIVFYMVTGRQLFPRWLNRSELIKEVQEYCEDHVSYLKERFRGLPLDRKKYLPILEKVLCPNLSSRCFDLDTLMPFTKNVLTNEWTINPSGYFLQPEPKFDMHYSKIDEGLVRDTVQAMYHATTQTWKLTRFAFIAAVDILCRVHRSVMYRARNQRNQMLLLGYMCMDVAIFLFYDTRIGDKKLLSALNQAYTSKDLESMRQKIRKALGNHVHLPLLTNFIRSDHTNVWKDCAVEIIQSTIPKHAFPYGFMTRDEIIASMTQRADTRIREQNDKL